MRQGIGSIVVALTVGLGASSALMFAACGTESAADAQDASTASADGANGTSDEDSGHAGHTMPTGDAAGCPAGPTVAPTQASGPSDAFPGMAPIASDFDPLTGLASAWGTGAIPQSASPDFVGAFRFICGAGQILRDDPIMYPCQPGASHLHQFYGNLEANAFSTFDSLRKSGKSTCANGNVAVNRSAYWTPAMLDGKGNVVQPDWEAVYYKRRPLNDPKCSRTSGDPQAEGDCVPIPNGIQFIFGWDPAKPDVKTPDYFNCDGPGATGGHYPDIPTAAAFCPVGSQILATLDAPSCWDGKNLDSPDHRSHMAFPGYGSWGYLKCPDTHPYVIPTFHLAIAYSIAAGDDLTKWSLASDTMAPPGSPAGFTLHGDYKEAWDESAKEMWTKGCVDGLLNCSGGDLGNGKQIIGASQPEYGWKNPNHLVPLSSIP